MRKIIFLLVIFAAGSVLGYGSNKAKNLYEIQIRLDEPGKAFKSTHLYFSKKNKCYCLNGSKKIAIKDVQCEAFTKKQAKILTSAEEAPPPVPPSAHDKTFTTQFKSDKTQWSQFRSTRAPTPSEAHYDFTIAVLDFCVK